MTRSGQGGIIPDPSSSGCSVVTASVVISSSDPDPSSSSSDDSSIFAGFLQIYDPYWSSSSQFSASYAQLLALSLNSCKQFRGPGVSSSSLSQASQVRSTSVLSLSQLNTLVSPTLLAPIQN